MIKSQLTLQHNFPNLNELENYKKIEILIAQPGLKEIEYNLDISEELCIQHGFKKLKIGTAPERAIRCRIISKE